MRRALTCLLAVVVTAGLIGCGDDDEQAANGGKPAARSSTTAAAVEPTGPTEADLRKFTCREFELGLTNTEGAYVISGVSSAAGVDINTAVKTVEDICRRAKPSVRPYQRAIRRLGGGK